MKRTAKQKVVHGPRRIESGTRRLGTPGSRLTCLVLAPGPAEWVAVDLDSGALVRNPAPSEHASALSGSSFEICSFDLAPAPEPNDPSRPEAVFAASEQEFSGRLRRRALRRLLRELAAPEQIGTPVLSARGPSVAYVDLDGSTPSVVVIKISPKNFELFVRPDGEVVCSLAWGGATQVLPVLDGNARAAATSAAPRPLHGATLSSALGFRPGYLCCGFGAVRDGHVPKFAIAVLPARP